MTTRRILFSLVSLCFLILLVAAVPGCSDNGTEPTPGGGGVAKELDSGTLAKTETYSHTFANAGTYNYHCTIHGVTMSGSVTVGTGHPATAPVAITDNLYTPQNAQVAPGGMVTWTNNGDNPHTVTSN